MTAPLVIRTSGKSAAATILRHLVHGPKTVEAIALSAQLPAAEIREAAAALIADGRVLLCEDGMLVRSPEHSPEQEPGSIEAHVLRALAKADGAAMSVAELSAGTNWCESSVRTAVNALVKTGELVKEKKEGYRSFSFRLAPEPAERAA